ncbi:hypothetical protein BKA67DRAFT_305959 [Truncatella angustata]|uniref:Uncharacterized protein n=1 Tax=Truncatella angustata TaxID=152316 RepID=A0A9P8ZXF8_9PEZI|nr:uncharacterized protein BKA67DRAFT_305959 [Truncatella angustata]KAH6652954.1 hypothetical protein BKA67DRAFT_305959 [Truncatella angustata]
MDAGESGTRQSGFTPTSTSAARPDLFNQHPRHPADQYPRERQSNMAAAALMSPASAYHPHNSAFSQSYTHPSPAPMSGILGQGDALRRASKDSEPSQRQSLPSISEMFSAKPSTYTPTTPTSMAGSSSLPPPPPPPPSYGNGAAARPEPASDPRPAPPHFAQRPDSGVAGPGYHQYHEPREPARPTEHHPQRNGSFSSSHVPPVPYTANGQLPPGQLPLSQAPPISPRYMGPPVPPPFDPQRPTVHPEEEYNMQRRYDPNALNRHFEAWGYTDCLQRVST